MNDPSAFRIQLPGFTSRSLTADDIPALQRLLESCADYSEIVEGTAVSTTAAQELFQSLPPGKSLSDKLVAGIVNRKGEIAGVVDAVAHYPEAGIWWIGLLLLAPDVRQQGVGREIVEAFVAFVRGCGGRRVMLGVVEDNRRAFEFWLHNGFILVRTSEPRTFGKKVQSVFVMERIIG